jgi:RNA polymerase nonessential primary-like sigma factor
LDVSLRDLLADIDGCEGMLVSPSVMAEPTRHGAADRLAQAVQFAAKQVVDVQRSRKVSATWGELQRATWQLALTARAVARREARRVSCALMSAVDLEQEGLLGLYDAALRFDPARGVRFSVYARWWVRAQILRTIQHTGAFRVSASALALNRMVQKVVVRDQQLGVERSMDAVGTEIGLSATRLRDVLAVRALSQASDGPEVDGMQTLAELPDPSAVSAEDFAASVDASRWLRRTMRTSLSERERHIVVRRNGLEGEAASMAEIGVELSLSTERVRQLEVQSRAVLRDVFARELG